MSAVPDFELNDGNTIPQLGFGVFQIDPAETTEAVTTALEAGYRHIDTAEMYGNEAEVGEAVRRSGLDRSEVFVTSKLNTGAHRPTAVIHGSWPTGMRRPGSDVDVLAVGDADLRELRRAVRPIGKAAGRTIDLTVLTEGELRKAAKKRSSFTRRLLESPTTPLVGDLTALLER